MKVKTKKEGSTHMPLLIKAVQATEGSVLELGAGIYSTPLLHWLCTESRRPLVTYERDPKYYNFAKKFRSRTHKIVHIDNWGDIDTKTHWSVALIDQDIDRGKTVVLLKDSADFIILHDSEAEEYYGYDKIWQYFKYRYDWKACKPWTTVVSNFDDLSRLGAPKKVNSKTIIYYTSNREDGQFEAKIRANILKQKGDLPVISISQKPLNFGKNICVGNVGHSYLNEYRQILIAAKAAKTDYIIFTEADFLYPESYFTLEPKGANVYRYDNVWIVFKDPRLFSYRRKPYSVGAQIANRKYVINLLEDHLKRQPMWHDGEFTIRNEKGRRKKDVFLNIPFEFFSSEVPCISFKTGLGMRRLTPVMHGRSNISSQVPYWGHVSKIREEYL